MLFPLLWLEIRFEAKYSGLWKKGRGVGILEMEISRKRMIINWVRRLKQFTVVVQALWKSFDRNGGKLDFST